MALHAPRRNAEGGGDVVGGEAFEVAQHEDLALAGGKPPEGRPDTQVLFAPDSLVLGRGGGGGRLVRGEPDTPAVPPPPPSGPPPGPAGVHPDPGGPGRPSVRRRPPARPLPT